MIVVIGSPVGRAGDRGTQAAGVEAAVARAPAAAGGSVQIVGRVGDDRIGDAVLLDLAEGDVGHVAVLRTGGTSTPVLTQASIADETAPGLAATGADDGGATYTRAGGGLPLEAADVELALRYLPDYRVLIVAPGLDPMAMTTVVAAAGWSGARLIAIVDGPSSPPDLPADATVLERPADGDDDAFAAMVARYAVEPDRGSEPGDAFVAASTAAGWSKFSD